jgi:hypothetical protein
LSLKSAVAAQPFDGISVVDGARRLTVDLECMAMSAWSGSLVQLSLKSAPAEQKLDAVELVTALSTCLLVGVAFWAKAAPARPSSATEAMSRCLMILVLLTGAPPGETGPASITAGQPIVLSNGTEDMELSRFPSTQLAATGVHHPIPDS